MPDRNQNNYFSETECQIYFKHGCIFKFVHFLEIHQTIFIIFDHGGPREGPFSPEPWESIARTIMVRGVKECILLKRLNYHEIILKKDPVGSNVGPRLP